MRPGIVETYFLSSTPWSEWVVKRQIQIAFGPRNLDNATSSYMNQNSNLQGPRLRLYPGVVSDLRTVLVSKILVLRKFVVVDDTSLKVFRPKSLKPGDMKSCINFSMRVTKSTVTFRKINIF